MLNTDKKTKGIFLLQMGRRRAGHRQQKLSKLRETRTSLHVHELE